MTAPVLQFKRGLLANLPGLRAGEPGFTTDSYDLYVGLTSETSTNKFFGSHRYWTKETTSTGSGVNLVEGTSNGSDYITLKSPDSLSGIGTYILPDTSTISDGYFLKVSTDGTLSWDTTGETDGNFSNPTLSGIVTVTNGFFDVNSNTDISGISTFSNTQDNTLGDSDTGAVQIDGGLGIDKNVTVGANLNVQGYSEFVGVSTFGSDLDINASADISTDLTVGQNLSVTGVSTFTDLVDANGGLDVTGGSTFDNIDVTGIGTVATADIDGGNIDGTVIGASSAAAGTFTELAYDNSSTSGISTVGSLYVGSNKVLSVEGSDLTLSSIVAIDATTKATLETSLALDPNDFDTLNVTGISTIGGLLDANGGLDVTGHSELDDLNVSGIATFSNAINADLLGNAGTATSLATARDFSITGDFVTATSVSFDGTGNVSLAATITANSIELGTYTSGDYVATVAGTANQITVSGSGSETAAVTLSLPNDVVVGTSLSVPTIKSSTIQHSNGTEALTIDASGNVGVTTNLTVSGNLYVNGSTTQVNTTSLNVEDRTIELGLVDGSAPSSATTWDLGVLFNYHATSAKKSAVIWEQSASRFVFGAEVSDGGGTDNDSPQITFSSYAPIEIGSLWVNDCAGQSQVISCTGTTRYLENITIDGGSF